MGDSEYIGNEEYGNRMDDLKQQVLALVDEHAKSCSEEGCLEELNIIAYLAHGIGMDSSGRCMARFINILTKYESRCKHCVNNAWRDSPSSAWGESGEFITEYWTWKKSVNSPPQIIAVIDTPDGVIATRQDGIYARCSDVESEWGGQFGPRVMVEFGDADT